jgi:hypothetical protein
LPFEVSNVDFTGKSIVQRTSAGTQGIVAALHAERLYAASLLGRSTRLIHMLCVRLSSQVVMFYGFTVRAGHIWIGVI